MTVGQKLYLSVGASIALTLVVGGLAYTNLTRMAKDMNQLGHATARDLYLAGDVNNLGSDILGCIRGMVLRSHYKDADKTRELYQTAMQELDRMKDENAEFIKAAPTDDLRDQAQALQDQIAPLKEMFAADYEMITKGNATDAEAMFLEKISPIATPWSSAGDKISLGEQKVAFAKADASMARVGPALMLSMSMMVVALVVGGLMVWIVRSITSTLMASVAELRDGADQTANAASQISTSSQSLAQGASEQAASLEETSASAEEINSMARKNTDNSRTTAGLLAQSQQKVNEANHHLEEMVVSMSQITESSGKISKIIKVIDEIAFQTNILALNAAVEAARAGEAGMGFAVVADEVRSLAQRSAQAAKDTATLIEDSIQRSNEGKGKVDQVAMAIRAVTEDSLKVKVMVDEVSLGSEEQSKGIDQIGRAIAQMEQVTQTTAANAEQSAAAAEELNAQSEALKDIVERLHAMVGGDSDGGSMRSMHRVAPMRIAPKAARAAGGFAKSTAPSARNYGTGAKQKASDADSFPMEESFQSF